MWLSSAERLRVAAEAVLNDELAAEQPFFQAVAVAEEEAATKAYAEGNDAGAAEIQAEPPNYPPAQLMYAYAIENVRKGLIMSKQPELIDK